MRTKNLVLSIGALLTIAGCAGTSPKPASNGTESSDLATYKGGKITLDDWNAWKKSSQMPASSTPAEESRQFGEYLKFRIDSMAARDAGLTKDSSLQRRLASIRQRIISERYRLDILVGQFGVSDTAIARYIAAHPDTTISTDSARVRAARAIGLQGIKIESVYVARKSAYLRDDSTYKPFDSARGELEMAVLRERSDSLTREFPEIARKLYKVETVVPTRPEIPVDSIKALYDSIKSTTYREPSLFHLRALGAKDSATLAKALAKVKDEAGFKALAAKFPVGTPKAAPEGLLGRVKSQFALPYGIGLVPQLFNELEPARTGLVNPIKVGEQWMAFWAISVDSGAVRSFESAKSDVAAEYEHRHPWVAPANAVVCKWDRGPLFTQSDVDFLYEEIPAHVRRQYPPKKIIEFMSLWAVVTRASEESGHSARPSVKQAIQDNERIYWAQEWRKSKDFQHFGLSKAKLDSGFAKLGTMVKKGFWFDTANGINRDGARMAIMPNGFLEKHYAEEMDQFRTDSVFSKYDTIKGDVFSSARNLLDAIGTAALDSTLRARYEVKLTPKAPGEGPKEPVSVRLDSARAKHDRRALDEAQALYEGVESDATAPDSLRAQALFQLGQLFGEQQSYPRSLSRYRAVLNRFPKSGEAYKAQFMIAFTYSEYLKLEKISLGEYRKVLANYPKCDLADDADWMIRNIESGGALMPKFDDIDTSKADSAKTKAPAAKPAAEAAKPAAAAAKAPAAKPAAEAAKPAADTTKAKAPAAKPAVKK